MDSKLTNSCIEKNLLQNKNEIPDLKKSAVWRGWSGSLNRSGTMTCGWRGRCSHRTWSKGPTELSSIQLETFWMWNYKGKKQLGCLCTLSASSAKYTERAFLLDKNPIGGTFSKKGFLEARYFVVEMIKRVKLDPLHKIAHLNRLVLSS